MNDKDFSFPDYDAFKNKEFPLKNSIVVSYEIYSKISESVTLKIISDPMVARNKAYIIDDKGNVITMDVNL